MPSYLNPALLWGLLLVGVPVLIHLINLMRHRRVPWAALEFLLASKKKNSAWIRMKELLLLLLRMGAVAAVVLMLAQPLLHNQFSRWFGGGRTHHIVLLDDSFSMADRWADTSALNEARRAIQRIGEQAASQPTPQSLTLLRFSRARRNAVGTQPDLLQEKVDTAFGRRLAALLDELRPSNLSVGPGPALQTIEQLLGDAEDEERSVYLVSDFRAAQWDQPGELPAALAQLNQSRASIHLIQCVDAAHPNVAITELVPAPGTRAAGVPLFMEVTVKNFGGERLRDISVLLAEDGQPRPALLIDEIAPGASETRRYQVFFATAGQHQLSARLESDALAPDNLRYAVVDLPLSVPVLVIDGNAGAPHGRFLAAALSPGGAVKTGIDPRIEGPSFLNANPLDKFQAVYLLDVDRLDPPAIDALEAFVQSGGGLGIFLGDRCRPAYYNDKLYREGAGFFPLPLAAKTQLLVDRLDKGPDLEVAEHPIFRVFAGERNSFLSAVAVDWYISAPKDWAPPADSATGVIARLRNGAPLAVERKYGLGRVVAFLTTAAPAWNNWGRNPSFVIAALEMQAHLASPPASGANRLVGSPIEVQLDPGRYQPQVRLVIPPDDAADSDGDGRSKQASADRRAATETADIRRRRTSGGNTLINDAIAGPDGLLAASFAEAAASGVYELQLTTTENHPESRRLALNVAADEGDLATVSGDELAQRLKGIRYEYRQAADFQMAPRELAGSNASQWILYLLVATLVGEQLLAYSASYHPPAREVAH